MSMSSANRASFVRERIPPEGLFAGQTWRISPAPFFITEAAARELESLGRVLLQFYRAANLLYRQSVAGKEPAWVAGWLDQGKPDYLVALQRSPAFKNDVPRVIRPDLLWTDSGLAITELDGVPGGIGLTAWLNKTYSELSDANAAAFPAAPGLSSAPADSGNLGVKGAQSGDNRIMGGAEGMLRGFEGIFGSAPSVHVIVSEEASTYRPEMQWLAAQLGEDRFKVRNAKFSDFAQGEAVYRFFELFDAPNVENSKIIFDAAEEKRILLTPPPKPIFEEKMLFALLWNRHLRGFWRRELGERFFEILLRLVPQTWLVDPVPLPPHGAIPGLELTDWRQLKQMSQRERELILKVSGFAETAWGARGVYLGSDLSLADWSSAVEMALGSFGQSPYVLQRYHKPSIVRAEWFDFEGNSAVQMQGRARLCPYYFVLGQGDSARAHLGGVLATICPAEKKIIHGMGEAVLAPCSIEWPQR
jgi:hypothetical protein